MAALSNAFNYPIRFCSWTAHGWAVSMAIEPRKQLLAIDLWPEHLSLSPSALEPLLNTMQAGPR